MSDGATREPEPTALLLEKVRAGEDAARERLVARFLPPLRRWARGRLPNHARGSHETDDLVQVTLMRALRSVDRFEPRGEGAFLAYLRRILLNAIRDEVRATGRRPAHDPLDADLRDPGPSVVEQAIGHQAMERYEAALGRLTPRQREAVLLRIEFGYPYARIAEALGSPSEDSARMMVSRALARMAREMA